MITIIVGTNRAMAYSDKIANIYSNILHQKNINNRILNLSLIDSLYRNETLIQIEKEYLIPAERFIFVLPEYNGSIPGIFKLFLDNTDIRKVWSHKKVALVGVADGRAGNLRGLDHATTFLQYMNMNVFYNKVYFSSVKTILMEDQIINERTQEEMNNQIDSFLKH